MYNKIVFSYGLNFMLLWSDPKFRHRVASFLYQRWASFGAGLLLVLLVSICFFDGHHDDPVVQPASPQRLLNQSAETVASLPFDPEWYRKTIFYQIWPFSFQDSDGDGIGDLNGIASRLQHFVNIGVGAIWLSPIYESPMLDNGYDISNFTNVDAIFGTLDDFRELLRKAKQLNLRVILDFVPNHSSNECAWFNFSRHRVDPYTDYYVWHSGNPDVQVEINGTMRNGIPNNWKAIFDGSTWEWDEVRQEYYYHAFLVQQPDFNYRSKALQAEMKNVMKFWFDLGVDGFRVDAYKHLVEMQPFLNNNTTRNPASSNNDPNAYEYYYKNLTEDQPEAFEVLIGWRNFVDVYAEANNRDYIFLVTESAESDVTLSMAYDTYKGRKAADFSFNFNLMNVTNTTTGYGLASAVSVWLDYLPEDSWPNWGTGNHDTHRVGDRLGRHTIDAMNMLNLLLPGTPFTYYGEEIGMVRNYHITVAQGKDNAALTPIHKPQWAKFTRDFERAPMQWKSTVPNAGFTTPSATPYLPVNKDLTYTNVEYQTSANNTHLAVYKQLAKLRHEPAFSDNKKLQIVFVDEDTFAFLRVSVKASDKYVIIVDLRQPDLPVKNVNLRISNLIPDFAKVVVADINSRSSMGLHKDVMLPTNAVPMVPGAGLVLKLL